MEEIKAGVAAVVQGLVGFSAWLFILFCYARHEDIPVVVSGVAVAVLAKYGIGIAGPTLARVMTAYFTKGK